ncbi:uncharacterized protein LOC107469462 [Arachis duranensis]|uniref:Uncharacterized protein LOC107469462 n=2 Tax=Arachis TaxID=3817 RepID=A0A6P4BWH3_ARADU|nr:uncharacterized protein LOC107469462 [Arachis duranensis]
MYPNPREYYKQVDRIHQLCNELVNEYTHKMSSDVSHIGVDVGTKEVNESGNASLFGGDDYMWKNNQMKFKVLAEIAKNIYAIPVSTIVSESAFNTSGRGEEYISIRMAERNRVGWGRVGQKSTPTATPNDGCHFPFRAYGCVLVRTHSLTKLNPLNPSLSSSPFFFSEPTNVHHLLHHHHQPFPVCHPQPIQSHHVSLSFLFFPSPHLRRAQNPPYHHNAAGAPSSAEPASTHHHKTTGALFPLPEPWLRQPPPRTTVASTIDEPRRPNSPLLSPRAQSHQLLLAVVHNHLRANPEPTVRTSSFLFSFPARLKAFPVSASGAKTATLQPCSPVSGQQSANASTILKLPCSTPPSDAACHCCSNSCFPCFFVFLFCSSNRMSHRKNKKKEMDMDAEDTLNKLSIFVLINAAVWKCCCFIDFFSVCCW